MTTSVTRHFYLLSFTIEWLYHGDGEYNLTYGICYTNNLIKKISSGQYSPKSRNKPFVTMHRTIKCTNVKYFKRSMN